MKPTEHQIQAAYFDWVKTMARTDWHYELIWSVPNALKMASAERHKGAIYRSYQREGHRAGVPDVHIAVPTEKHPAAWIETKRPGGKLSVAQKEKLTMLRKAGHNVAVCYSTEEMISFTVAHMSNREKHLAT